MFIWQIILPLKGIFGNRFLKAYILYFHVALMELPSSSVQLYLGWNENFSSTTLYCFRYTKSSETDLFCCFLCFLFNFAVVLGMAADALMLCNETANKQSSSDSKDYRSRRSMVAKNYMLIYVIPINWVSGSLFNLRASPLQPCKEFKNSDISSGFILASSAGVI